MKAALKILLISAVLTSFCNVTIADTGTYQILDYRVKLTPKSDGTVEIEYFQRWMVTGGSIPWITVGTPNSDFTIVPRSNKGNAARVYASNAGDWSGVRVDLDQNYGPSRTFEVGFTIIETRLFYAEGNNYRLVFWPGWYDRAKTDSLRVEMFFFAKLDTVKADPKPGLIEGQSMIWERKNLAAGEKFKISVSIPRTFMAAGISTGTTRSVFSGIPWPVVICGLILAFIFIMVFIEALRHGFGTSYGSGPIIDYGSGRHSGGSKGGKGGGGIFGGGGGGFGGRSFSCVCACACAGCACACACAGGGAAGCERKLSQRCSLCRECKSKDTCAVWNGNAE